LTDGEHMLPTPHPKLHIAQARKNDADWLARLLEWVAAATMPDDAVRAALKQWVPEYQPSLQADASLEVSSNLGKESYKHG